jgi:hypothetical protein
LRGTPEGSGGAVGGGENQGGSNGQ